jgi:hypothetical protein
LEKLGKARLEGVSPSSLAGQVGKPSPLRRDPLLPPPPIYTRGFGPFGTHKF